MIFHFVNPEKKCAINLIFHFVNPEKKCAINLSCYEVGKLKIERYLLRVRLHFF
jgi:hypothetical protein